MRKLCRWPYARYLISSQKLWLFLTSKQNNSSNIFTCIFLRGDYVRFGSKM